MIKAIARAGLMLGALFVALATLGIASNPAAAKQCIWNKGGFILRIDWFEPGDVEVTTGADGNYDFAFKDQPVQTDVFPTANGRCINRGDVVYFAVFSICGAEFPHRASYPDDWPVGRRIDCSLWGGGALSTTRYLDFWGIIWEPHIGQGGPI